MDKIELLWLILVMSSLLTRIALANASIKTQLIYWLFNVLLMIPVVGRLLNQW